MNKKLLCFAVPMIGFVLILVGSIFADTSCIQCENPNLDGSKYCSSCGEKYSRIDQSYIKLRSTYKDSSVAQIQSMYNMSIRSKEDNGFKGHCTINHNYNLKSINSDKVVLDYTTKLMWHQNGSNDRIVWEKAKEWISALNSRGYAGYNDWRLPTVEEAASLLEPSKSNDLYIDSIFSYKQRWIWTGDRRNSSGDLWKVAFYSGKVSVRTSYIIRALSHIFSDSFGSYVRPVRSAN